MPRLHFKGKVFVENHHLAVPYHELLPVREKGLSEKASLHDNLIVHGDNLAALKSLLPTYHGKVKLHLHRSALQHGQRRLGVQRQREFAPHAGLAGPSGGPRRPDPAR